ncbi:MAG: insulinase family protein [Candidatus Omnitrophica bacterium]|nr:insulinase family protein [Candidatus Omnitrophota bacterium]
MNKVTTLLNGLRIITNDVKAYKSVAIGIWSGVGGRYEQGALKGAAHFLEHIVFKGSHKYSCEEIKMKIEGIGGTLNAFTAEEQTCFYAKIPSKFLSSTFDVLSDIAFFPNIAQKDVTKERTVICEEIKMYQDVPQYHVIEMLDRLLWPDHPLGQGIAGSQKTVKGMTAKDLKGFHKVYYSPSNSIIAACGNINHDQLVTMVKRKLGHLERYDIPAFQRANNQQDKARVAVEKRPIEQMHVAMGVLAYDQSHKDRSALTLLNVILGGNMSSRLFEEVREKRGLAYSISSSLKLLNDTGTLLIRAGVDNTNLVSAIKLIMKVLNQIKRTGVTDNEFSRAKDYLLGQLMLGLEDTMDQMLWIGEGLIAKNEVRRLEDLIKAYKKVKKEDIKRIAKEIFNKNQFNLAVVGPISEEQQRELNKIFI